MKKLSRRSVLLLSVMLAVCAFAPSMALAASWTPVGTTHQLFASELAFTAHDSPVGPTGWICSGMEFDADVASGSALVITGARFSKCSGFLATAHCTLTMTATGLPWTVTAPSTTSIQFHNVRIDMVYDNTPGDPTNCAVTQQKALLTGTLAGGSWDSANSTVTLASAGGLTTHFSWFGITAFGATTISAAFHDTGNSLGLAM